MKINLTENQKTLLRAFNNHDYSWCDAYSPELIGDNVYGFAVCEGFAPESCGGILAQARKAGLIGCTGYKPEIDEWEYSLTELGFKALLIIDNRLHELREYERSSKGSLHNFLISNDLWINSGSNGLTGCPDKIIKRIALLFILETDASNVDAGEVSK